MTTLLIINDVYIQVDSINATYIANQNIGSDVRTLISFDNGGNWQLLKPPPSTLTCQAVSIVCVM